MRARSPQVKYALRSRGRFGTGLARCHLDERSVRGLGVQARGNDDRGDTPGHGDARISRSARARSGKNMSAIWQSTRSNEALGKGKASASPWRHSIPGRTRRATASMASFRSSPMTFPRRPCGRPPRERRCRSRTPRRDTRWPRPDAGEIAHVRGPLREESRHERRLAALPPRPSRPGTFPCAPSPSPPSAFRSSRSTRPLVARTLGLATHVYVRAVARRDSSSVRIARSPSAAAPALLERPDRLLENPARRVRGAAIRCRMCCARSGSPGPCSSWSMRSRRGASRCPREGPGARHPAPGAASSRTTS